MSIACVMAPCDIRTSILEIASRHVVLCDQLSVWRGRGMTTATLNHLAIMMLSVLTGRANIDRTAK